MTVVRLEEEDLDEEDLAILAEVSKKGYYHGRPKNEVGPAPTKIVAPPPQKLEAGSSVSSRANFDDFQRKWDRFDDDSYLKKLERETISSSTKASPSVSSTAVPKPSKPVFAAEFKILLVGDGGVGKSAFLKSHITGEFERKWTRSTQEEVHQLRFRTNCGEIALNIHSINNSVPVSNRCRSYLSGHAAIVMFDLTSRSSFRSVPNWQRELKQALGTLPTVLVGNKADVEARQVTPQQLRSYIRPPLQYFEVSLFAKSKFDEPFLWLLRRLANQPKLRFTGTLAKAPQLPSSAELADRASCQAHQRWLQEALTTTVESHCPL